MIRPTEWELLTITNYLKSVRPEKGKEDRFRHQCRVWRQWWEDPQEYNVEDLLISLRTEYWKDS